MTKAPTAGSLALVSLVRGESEPLFEQVYRALRSMIEHGRLRRGTRVPSTRVLARELGVSRGTVTMAFENLAAEGYVESIVGSGTYVRDSPPMSFGGSASRHVGSDSATRGDEGGPRRLSKRSSLLATPAAVMRPSMATAFEVDVPAIDAFPHRLWDRIAARRCARGLRDLYACCDPAGYPPLRDAIAQYLAEARDLRCSAGQVIVVAGTLQAVDLIARVLLDSGNGVWMEEPGRVEFRNALRSAGADVSPIPVDRDGLVVETAQAAAPEARLALVTPSSHHPLGVTMSIGRRIALVRWAIRHGMWLVEDDTGYELARAAQEHPSLWSLDGDSRVIYISGFRSILLPSLRLGFLVVPPDLVDTFLAARFLADGYRPLLEQAIVAEFISEGHLSAHVRRMRQLYVERQSAFVEILDRELAGVLEPDHSGGSGLQTSCRVLGPQTANEVALRAAAVGVIVRPLHDYYLRKPERDDTLLLGHTSLQQWLLRDRVKALARALEAGA